MSNVSEVPNIERNKIVGLIEEMRRNMPVMLEYSSLNAQMKRSQYIAFVDAGFTEAQSLELCK